MLGVARMHQGRTAIQVQLSSVPLADRVDAMSILLDRSGLDRLEGTGIALANRLGMAQADLRRIERASERLERSREELLVAILNARDSGESFRDIARAAGMSHQRVHQIVREKGRPQ